MSARSATGRAKRSLSGGNDVQDYQLKKSRYRMETTRYRRALAIMRDYDRLKATEQAILYGSPSRSDVTGAPKGVPSDPTAQRALRLERIDDELRAIEAALARIPRDMRAPVMENIVNGRQCPAWFLAGKYNCSARVIGKWKQRLLWEVAERMVP